MNRDDLSTMARERGFLTDRHFDHAGKPSVATFSVATFEITELLT